MASRIASATVGLPLLALAVWLGAPWFTLLAAAASAVGAVEICNIARRRGVRPIAPLAGLWAATLVAGAHFLTSESFVWAIVPVLVGAGALATAVPLRRSRGTGRPADWGVTAGAALCVGGLLSFAPLLRELDQGREWMFLLLIVTFATDTSAFFVGRSIGKRPLAPSVSPGKTWEGAVGGLLGAVAACAASVHVLGLGTMLASGVLLGALMGVVAQLGDLAESKLKRVAGVKDSGSIIPGHGGILDRLDSIVLNLALVYYWVICAIQ